MWPLSALSSADWELLQDGMIVSTQLLGGWCEEEDRCWRQQTDSHNRMLLHYRFLFYDDFIALNLMIKPIITDAWLA